MPKKVLFFYLALVIIVGIGSRLFHTGFFLFDKYLGDALYAVMVYLLVSILWGEGSPPKKAILTVALMSGIEAFQLTLIPLQFRLSDHTILKVISILLGTTFSWLDLIAYLAGISAIYIVDQKRLLLGYRSSFQKGNFISIV
jgi:hypothetical protein